jgi:molecular chaperone GrpE
MSSQKPSQEASNPELDTEILVEPSTETKTSPAESDQTETESIQPEAEATPDATIEDLQSALEKAQQEAAANLDKALRVQAEMENLKRRVQKDLDDERKFGLSKFAKELLSVLDSLELGIQAATGDSPEVQKLKEGSELTIKQFESVFAKFNIEAIDPVNQPFNPDLHQAMVMQPSSTIEPGHVITVFQKGYVINGRLLRPAMVVVAKAEEATKN